MEETRKYTAWGVDAGVRELGGLKPMLTPEEQVSLLKGKGVAFERCGEEAAIAALSERGSFLHLTSYRKLFQRHCGGPKDGMFVRLDFEDLLYLDDLDAELRRAFLSASQDVERLAKTRVIARASEHPDEDGYGIVADFMESQDKRYRNATARNLEIRMGSSVDADEYTGSLIKRYCEAMPVWVFLEVVTFGTFLAFCLFCSERWGDLALREEHYVMKGVKAVRNCCSHGSCIINGLEAGRDSDYAMSTLVFEWLKKKGVKNSRTRRKKLRNRRVQQLLETLVMFDRLHAGSGPSETCRLMSSLSGHMRQASSRFGCQNGFVSYLDFLAVLIDKAV